MLLNLHVKNLAIIDEEEIELNKGLNILSGETGAGKSIILGALGLAMGQKPSKGLIRDESKESFVEAIFSVNEYQKKKIEELGVEVYDNEIILQRKIMPQRSSAKINGESYPSNKLSQVAGVLIDIYGQHEQQTLLSSKNHILLVDEYGKSEISTIKKELQEAYDNYKNVVKEYDELLMDDASLYREIDLLKHEIAEIEYASISINEDDELKEEFKKLSKVEKIREAVSEAKASVGETVTEDLGRAIRSLRSVEDVDTEIVSIIDILNDVEVLMRDASLMLFSYDDKLDSSPQRLLEVSDRIDLLDSLKRRFSKKGTLQEVLDTLESNQEKLEKLNNYEKYIEKLKYSMEEYKNKLIIVGERLTRARKKTALELTGLINEALLDLNFGGEGMEIRIEPADEIKRNGADNVSFYISTNPGEPMRPLNTIASGGELSRIMLAIKTIFAGTGEIDTLVFDEIDSGVSGKTAAKVAERLSMLSKDSQIICITHLPQIAAKANTHFLIEKIMDENSTVSSIRMLDKNERINEVARMLAGDEITNAAIENAQMLIGND